MEDHKKHHESKKAIKKVDSKVSNIKESDVETKKPVDSKKSLRTVLLIVFGVIIILAGIVLLSKYVFTNKNTVEYNNYTFTKFEGNKWMTQQLIREQVYNIPFYNNPTQVQDVVIDPNSIVRIRQFSYNPNGTTYISVEPNESSKTILAGVEYARILGNAYSIYNMNVKSAITRTTNASGSLPVMTCKNQSKDTFIIIQTMSDKNLISLKGNCVTIEYLNANESIRVADAFAFRLLNIIR